MITGRATGTLAKYKRKRILCEFESWDLWTELNYLGRPGSLFQALVLSHNALHLVYDYYIADLETPSTRFPDIDRSAMHKTTVSASSPSDIFSPYTSMIGGFAYPTGAAHTVRW